MTLALPTIRRQLPTSEFVVMLALMTSMAAMAVDSMLPALATMGSELGASSSNTPQLIISASMFGLAAGQILYGPLSDSWGRRQGVFLGIGIFICGTLLCIFARDFNNLMIGRVLQGIGAAGPRVICTSIVRDLYVGRSMARIISIVMGIFIMVPALAPTLGQFVLVMAGWRMIFIVLLAQAVIAFAWYGLRQAETLKPEFRRSLSASMIWEGFVEVATNRISFWYTVAAGCTFGGFVGYLMSSPQIFADLYGVTDTFPYYFGALSLCIGLSSLLNAKLVLRLGMRRLCLIVLITHSVLSFMCLTAVLSGGGALPLGIFLVWAACAFFAVGALFGNFNAIAMEPLGHLAGIGAAFVGSLSTFISVSLGTTIGQMYDGTILPLVASFAVLGLVSLTIMKCADDRI